MVEDILGASVPIVAIVLGMGMGFWRVYWDHQRKRLQYEERRLMIEKGMTPPPMVPDLPRKTAESSLRTGIIFLFLGIGLAIAYGILQGPDLLARPHGGMNRALAIAASVVALLGAGHLVYYRVATNHAPSLYPPQG